MNKAIKYRAYPNEEQLHKIWTNIHCARAMYNIMLADKISYYTDNKKMLYNTPAQYKENYPWLREADSLALANVQQNLEQAFRNFFTNPKTGFPNFKSRHKTKWSYTTNKIKTNISLEGGYIKLPKLGFVKIKQHRTAPESYKLKSVTVTITPTLKVFVSVLYEYESQVSPVTATKALGLDYSSPHLYIDSEGREPDFEKPFRKYQKKLAKEQRILSKMKEANKGRPLSECKNYQKQKLKVAKIHEKISNCRKDFLHKLSFELAENYDLIGVEDLNMRAMSQCLTLGKSTMDNGYGMFLNFLEYKLSDRGKHLIKVDKWYPSTKTCSCCGNTKPMRLLDREYVCPECGAVIPRDYNAAINICNETIRTAGQVGIACLCSVR